MKKIIWDKDQYRKMYNQLTDDLKRHRKPLKRIKPGLASVSFEGFSVSLIVQPSACDFELLLDALEATDARRDPQRLLNLLTSEVSRKLPLILEESLRKILTES